MMYLFRLISDGFAKMSVVYLVGLIISSFGVWALLLFYGIVDAFFFFVYANSVVYRAVATGFIVLFLGSWIFATFALAELIRRARSTIKIKKITLS